MYSAKVLADSLNIHALPYDLDLDHRLTTMELRYPRCIHPEFLTHAAFCRNSASSRAIPINKMLEAVEANPFIPLVWGSEQKGMQAGQEIEYPEEAEKRWLLSLYDALKNARLLRDMGLHKQIVNRIVEPWMWITVIATGNRIAWENFFHLRCSEYAEPHIAEVAYMARDAYDESIPKRLGAKRLPIVDREQMHLPLIGFEGDDVITDGIDLLKISTGRIARVSYLTHEGRRDIQADIQLHDKLKDNGHWSPFGHPAITAYSPDPQMGGNLGPWWIQYRKMFPNEVCRRANRIPNPNKIRLRTTGNRIMKERSDYDSSPTSL